MSLQFSADGEFTVTSWQEHELEGDWSDKRMMDVKATFECTGDINGTFLVTYYMTYGDETDDPHDRQAQYAGYLAFDGSLQGKVGKFSLQDSGVYREGAPFSRFSVVHDSGEGELRGIQGHGLYYADGDLMKIKLEYSLE